MTAVGPPDWPMTTLPGTGAGMGIPRGRGFMVGGHRPASAGRARRAPMPDTEALETWQQRRARRTSRLGGPLPAAASLRLWLSRGRQPVRLHRHDPGAVPAYPGNPAG